MKILIWAEEEFWTGDQVKEIVNSFKPLKVSVDKDAAIGTGAE